MIDEKKEESKTAKDLSSLTDAVNQILAAADCPQEFRGFIDCLVGLAEGKYEIEATDIQVSRAARPDKTDILDNSARKWAQRTRGRLNDWQRKRDLTFVVGKPGHKIGIVCYSTSYYLPLIKNAEDVIDKAQKDMLWETEPHEAIKKAAKLLVDNLKPDPRGIPKKRKFDKLDYKEVGRGLRTARTKLANVMDLLRTNDTGIYNENIDLVDELEKLIDELKYRIDYYGNW